MVGVDHVISIGVADPDRMAVMGWSYGGYMTSWVITQTKRFRAAVIGAAVTNLWSFTGTSDIVASYLTTSRASPGRFSTIIEDIPPWRT